ncbi:MAG: hypothetical protein KHX55_01160 [Proteobacteria bacterium]|nr:hypothetical protein [Pseudomonadota bacterium]
MKTIYIAKKAIARNAVAFLKLENGKLVVAGKFYDGPRGYPGPEVTLNNELPTTLIDEVELRDSWAAEMTDELADFADKMFAEAAAQESWFE